MPTLTAALDAKKTSAFVDQTWDDSIVPKLVEYIKIPNKSPHFDKEWKEHGHMDKAVALIADWCRARKIAGLKLQVVQKGKRTPVIFMEIPASSTTRCSCTATSTSSRRWSAGSRVSARGRR
jgi:hypothetical protein